MLLLTFCKLKQFKFACSFQGGECMFYNEMCKLVQPLIIMLFLMTDGNIYFYDFLFISIINKIIKILILKSYKTLIL